MAIDGWIAPTVFHIGLEHGPRRHKLADHMLARNALLGTRLVPAPAKSFWVFHRIQCPCFSGKKNDKERRGSAPTGRRGSGSGNLLHIWWYTTREKDSTPPLGAVVRKAVGKVVAQGMGNLVRQRRFANPAHANKRHDVGAIWRS